jgi:hypothetical protein
MHHTDWRPRRPFKRMFSTALAVAPVLFSGCARTGGTADRASVVANPAMYHYDPGTRGFETRWPFGPANYH